MKTLRIIETFSGIGAQHKAISKINKVLNNNAFEIIATCEWDIFSNITYGALHKPKYKVSKISFDKQKKFLLTKSWSRDGSTRITEKSFNNLSPEVINNLFHSVKGHNNFGSINNLCGKHILDSVGEFDVLTYSFPCQNLSTAGAFHGANKGMAENSGTKSGLIWEIKRILEYLKKQNKLPKYLLLENVPSIRTKHRTDFIKWLDFLKELNYNTNTQILNAEDFGIPQRRKRAFALSILDYKGKLCEEDDKFEFNIGGPEIHYNKSKITKTLQDIIKDQPQFIGEYNDAVPNDTPSRKKMREHNPKLKEKEVVRTITTKQDRHPNCGTINYTNHNMKNKSNYRFITPRESFVLMGFDSKDYEKAKKAGIRKELLYKQTGNSIVVNVLVSIFNKIYEIEKEKLNATK